MHTIIDFRWLLRLLVFSVGTACAGRRAPGGAYTWMDPSVGVGVAGPAYALLQEYAEDLDGPTRAAALEILVRGASEPGGGRHGIAAIWDPEPWVQRAAVRALAARGDEPASVAHLAALAARTDVDPYVRCRAALLVPGEPSDAVRASVRHGWQSAPLWRALPCATADAARGSEEALAVVQEALSSGAIALDPDFVDTLSVQSLEGIDAAMIQGLSTADELVRPAYTAALLARGNDHALAQVRASLSDPDPLVRMEGVLLLTPIDTPSALGLLSHAAAADQTPEGRVASLALAARQGGAFKTFEEAWSGDNRDVRRAAIVFGAEHVLRQEARGIRSARKRLEGLLADALVDPDPITCTEALRQVGRTGMRDLAPVVEALLLDDEAEDIVRITAAAALVRLGAAA